MQQADAVVVSTIPLAAAMQQRVPEKPVYVAPNMIDCEYWDKAYVSRLGEKKDHVTIGWMASGSHVIDAPLIREPLRRLMKRHPNLHLHFIGWIGFEHLQMDEFKDRVTVQPWIECSVLPDVMANFDIGIAPLISNQFNDCKSGLKAMQYWALGLPVVASKVPAYNGLIDHGQDGYYADSEEEWESCLEHLITDEVDRRNMGEMGRAKALAQHDVRRRIGDWVKVYEQINRM